MENSYRINFRNPQFHEKEKADSLRSSQLSLLNLNDLTRSSVNSNDSKSQRTPNKLNYKYQRINNSFRLVQIDQSDSDNKENVQEPSKSNAQILMTLNALTERIEKLERGQYFDEQKQQFYIHKIVERIVTENKDSKYFQAVEKKLEYAFYEINQIKQKLFTLSNQQSLSRTAEENVVKKCKELIQDQSNEKNKILGRQYEEMLIKINQNCSQAQKNMKSMLCTLGSELSAKIEQVSKKSISLEDSHKIWETRLQEDLRNIYLTLSSLGAKFEAVEPEQKRKCTNKIVGQISLQLRLSSAIQRLGKKQQGLEIVRYGLDKEGYLVDCEGFYLIDKRGKTVKLNEQQVKKLEDMNILEKK